MYDATIHDSPPRCLRQSAISDLQSEMPLCRALMPSSNGMAVTTPPARHLTEAGGGSGTDRMRASVVTVKRPTSDAPAANIRVRWLRMYSGDSAWILRNTIPGGVGSRRRNTSSPKSRSKVMTTRCCAAPNASTSSSGAPGQTDRTGTTSCPSAYRPRIASRGTFSSAKKRG